MSTRMRRTGGLAIAGCLFILLASACTDVGDSSNGNPGDGSTPAGDDTGSVLEAGGDSTVEGSSPEDASMEGAQGEAGLDGAVIDATVTGADAAADSGLPGLDATTGTGGDSSMDAGRDSGADGGPDSAGGSFEAGVDAAADGSPDAEAADARPDAEIDAHVVDAAPDAPSDAGSPCALNGSASGACTPTEALFAAHSQTCVNALFNNGCLDDNVGDVGNECTDVPAGTTPSGATRNQACLTVISCTLAHSSAQPVVDFGYCGTQPTSVSCQTATPGQTGPCLAQEQDGEESTDPTTVLSRYTATTFGGGMANRIFNCAITNVGASPDLQTCLQ
jgi:hypothetical protein